MFEKKYVNYLFFLIIVILSLITIAYLLKPFAMVIFFAAVFYVVLNPLYLKILSKVPKKSTILFPIIKMALALLMSILSFVIFLIPTAFLAYVIATQVINLINVSTSFFQNFDTKLLFENKFISDINHLLEEFKVDQNVINSFQSSILSQLNSFSGYLTQNIASIIKGTGTFITSFIFMMFTLFFLLLDGKYLLKQVMYIIPIDTKYTKRLLRQMSSCIKNIIYGNLLTGLIQSIVGFIVFSIFRAPNSLMFASLIIIASFIPILGTSMVWLPLGILMIIRDGAFKGILFLIVSSTTISLSDNFLRPFFLSNSIDLHPIFIFFAILGGVFAFGISGIILGPLCFVLFFEVMKIYHESNTSSSKNSNIVTE